MLCFHLKSLRYEVSIAPGVEAQLTSMVSKYAISLPLKWLLLDTCKCFPWLFNISVCILDLIKQEHIHVICLSTKDQLILQVVVGFLFSYMILGIQLKKQILW